MKNNSTPEVSFSHYGGKPPENYERYFVPTIGAAWATALLEVSGLSSGERVLDVACGTGIVTRRASELVGPEGFVAGLDVNPAMLAVARSVSPTSIEWHESSAESIPCPDASFDVVTCSLGLQFVPDRSAAMREIRRVLVDGGRVAIGTVGAIPPVFEILAQALARHVKPGVAAFVRQVFSLHEPRELHDLAEGAGLRSVSVESKPLRIMLPPLRAQTPRPHPARATQTSQGSEGQQQEAHRGHPIGGLKITVVQRSPVPAERRSCNSSS